MIWWAPGHIKHLAMSIEATERHLSLSPQMAQWYLGEPLIFIPAYHTHKFLFIFLFFSRFSTPCLPVCRSPNSRAPYRVLYCGLVDIQCYVKLVNTGHWWPIRKTSVLAKKALWAPGVRAFPAEDSLEASLDGYQSYLYKGLLKLIERYQHSKLNMNQPLVTVSIPMWRNMLERFVDDTRIKSMRWLLYEAYTRRRH